MDRPEILICVTGASGSVYAGVLFKILEKHSIMFDLIFSQNGKNVYEHEYSHKLSIDKIKAENSFKINDFFTRPASGSSKYKTIIIIPCSMGTIGRIASGISDNLITRAADVALKEQSQLFLCFRESPLNVVHLENLLKLKNAGASIFPLNPSFYFQYDSIDEVVENLLYRLLNLAGYSFDEQKKWE
ncbi:MAG: UbiX family flavin prenyltransferase [Candidatus Delongbacteria bacterium]|nr:UbiX family flavin prenyltransferase [Candidatus Delongbacteria bacterium]MBN2834171.1 UbiX family flavin prenyltransferase [Candidatus Delongbacteria bacterium]